MANDGTTLDCDAILFDLDGVLVDSHPLIERILRAWAADRGVDPDVAVAASYGRRDIDLVRVVAPTLDAEVEAAWIVEREERDFTGVVPIPGAAGLLAALSSARWAIVTSGTRRVARGRLRAAELPEPVYMITAEDVIEGKPAPEGYLRAAELLGVAPNRCLVVEDAESGVRAAEAAGMRCLGIGTALADGGIGAALDAWATDLRSIDPEQVTAEHVRLNIHPNGSN
ncbi:HAD-IA family hydrolase [Embleya hyalina]|uniref:Phosphatase n=1 Tax=Embleya hyalina TaxID=516124 RepID=A0A401YRK6_9ACTN|nr:HAD-IA family hydrolase [Embleya hyalina]GCD97229.1 phosphatase [Embleya hyalina]